LTSTLSRQLLSQPSHVVTLPVVSQDDSRHFRQTSGKENEHDEVPHL
jgi:hypothetical protein